MPLVLAYDFETDDFDLVLGERGLVESDSLETALWISLHTDARAQEGDTLPTDDDDPRGWWATSYMNGDEWGSRLWLLDRATSVASTFRFARDYAKESMVWLVEDDVAETADAQAYRTDSGYLEIRPKLTKGNGQLQRYADNWAATPREVT